MAEVDALARAPAALVHQLPPRRLAVQRDLGFAAAEGVAVGLRAHHFVREGEDVFGCPVVDPAAGAVAGGVVEGDVTGAGRADFAAVGGAAGVGGGEVGVRADWGWSRCRCRSRRWSWGGSRGSGLRDRRGCLDGRWYDGRCLLLGRCSGCLCLCWCLVDFGNILHFGW